MFLVRNSNIYIYGIRIRTNQSRSGDPLNRACFSHGDFRVYHINRQFFKIKVLETFYRVFSPRVRRVPWFAGFSHIGAIRANKRTVTSLALKRVGVTHGGIEYIKKGNIIANLLPRSLRSCRLLQIAGTASRHARHLSSTCRLPQHVARPCFRRAPRPIFQLCGPVV